MRMKVHLAVSCIAKSNIVGYIMSEAVTSRQRKVSVHTHAVHLKVSVLPSNIVGCIAEALTSCQRAGMRPCACRFTSRCLYYQQHGVAW
jgi:hypothetical protein